VRIALLLTVVLAGAAAAQDPERDVDGLAAHTFTRADVPVRLALSRVRAAYVAAVDEPSAIDVGLAHVAGLDRGSAPEGLLRAYEGAFTMLRARHAFWPRAKWRHAQDGLAILDRAVAFDPDHAEVRYLRLVSSYYLPFFFGRGDAVAEDFAALAGLLPAVRDDYPEDWYEGVVRFVVEHGGVSGDRRRALLDVLDEEPARAENP